MLLVLIPISLIGYYLNKFIIKLEIYLYTIATALAVVGIMYFENSEYEIITSGFLGFSFLLVVMFAGAFKRNSNINKRLRSIRKIYSIVGFILMIPHITMYFSYFLSNDIDRSLSVFLGIITSLIMIPLFIISFGFIKKKIHIKKWYAYQRLAYIAYFTLFLHLILLNNERQPIYLIIFGIYFSMKLKNYLFKNVNHLLKTSIVTIIMILIFIVSKDDSVIETTDFSTLSLVDGTYYATEPSYSDYDVILDLFVTDGRVSYINLIDFGGTDPLKRPEYQQAAEYIVSQVLENQTTDIDVVAGATETSEAVLTAINKAVIQAIE